MRDTTRRGFLGGIAAVTTVATVPTIGAVGRVWLSTETPENVTLHDAETTASASGSSAPVESSSSDAAGKVLP